MNGRWKASALAALVGVGLALAGCGQAPLGPSSIATGGGLGGISLTPPIVTLASNGTVDYVWAPVGAAVVPSVSLASALPRSVSASAKLDGSKGGTVRAGRFRVALPPGAFSGFATVTVSVADTTVMICDLSISPQSANKFAYPALLITDYSGTTVDVSTVTTYWYDPTQLLWVSLSGRSNVSGTTVVTSLDHFSTYASGKAGW